MNKIKIFLRGENNREPQIIEIDEASKVNDIVIKHHEVFTSPNEKTEEFEIFIEDEDEPKCKDHHHSEAGIIKHSNIHCHRCKSISIELVYNGRDKKIEVSPSTTGDKILSLIPKQFPNISPQDAADLRLKMTDGSFIEKTDHIGSFVAYPCCEIKLELVPHPKIQG